jgi:hypothetical protein
MFKMYEINNVFVVGAGAMGACDASKLFLTVMARQAGF